VRAGVHKGERALGGMGGVGQSAVMGPIAVGHHRGAVLRAQRWSAETQEGVISRAQVLSLGMTDDMIRWRLQRGIWQRLYPGVYATFSGDPVRLGWLWAAVLRAGPGSMLSHQTAAELWDIKTRQPAHIHVTVPSGSPVAPIPGVTLHYSRRIQTARHPALAPPRTRVEETVLDLAQAAATLDDALSWVFGACGGRLTTAGHLTAAMQLRRRMRWRDELAQALADAGSGVHSVLEHRYLNGVERAHGLPAGTRQWLVRRGSRRQYADVAYEAYRTLVELDGRTAHPEHGRWQDIRRDNANAADGRVTLRYGWIEVNRDPCGVAREVADVLRRHGWAGTPRRCGRSCTIAGGQVPTSAWGA
jgi:predicted transcriptional regulator of viral defense system